MTATAHLPPGTVRAWVAASSCVLAVACGTTSGSVPDTAPATTENPSDAAATTRDPVGDPCPSCNGDGGARADANAGALDGGGPLLAVFSAFPAETAPLLAQMTVDSTMVINGRTFRLGTLKGVRVAVGLTGMGLTSASATAHALLAKLPITGVVFSGVAGSKERVGDVAVPTSWSLKTTGTYAPNAAWLKLATDLVSNGKLCFERCTVVPATGLPVCLDHVPAAFVTGVGQSDDISVPMACQASGDDVFGCDVGAGAIAANQCQAMGPAAPSPSGSGPIVTDNETAAVAVEAAARNLPFIAFRGISDGSGDPLGLPGYPSQFFAYYRLAARNAAAATTAFVERVGTTTP